MNQPKTQEVRQCTFEMEVTEGTGNIKFPCSCFVEWKTSNGKDTIKSPIPVKLIQRKLAFKQRLILTTPLVYDISLMTYLKKQSVIILNLLSNSRPNEPKLVGRITIELSSVANGNRFNQMAQYPLQFCSVEATLTFRVVLKDYTHTNLALSDLDRSQYSELEQIGGDRQAAKEDTQSESGAKSISSANISEGVSNRLKKQQPLQKSSESSFQDRINRIKSQNQHLYKIKPPEGYSSRLKREMEGGNANIKTDSRQQRSKQSANQQRPLSNDLSVPILTKNADEFDSNKVSERTISHPNKSEKEILFQDSKINNNLLKDSNESLQQQFHSIKNGIQSKKQVEPDSSPNYQSQISELRYTMGHLKAENNNILRQLEYKTGEMNALTIENTQANDCLSKLNQQLAIKTKHLEEIQALNYPALFQQLNRTIQEKDREIQSLIHSTFQAEKNIQDKYASLQQQNSHLKEHINQLEETKIRSLQQKQSKSQQTSPIRSQKSSPGKQQKASQAQMQRLRQRIEDLTYNLGIEHKNNQNSRLELAQVQQWYKEIQEQAERLSIEKEEVRRLLQDQKLNSAGLQLKIDLLVDSNQLSAAVSTQLSNKQQVIKSLTSHLNEVSQELDSRNATIEGLQYNSSKLEQQLQSTKKELDDIQSKFVEQQQILADSFEKITQLSNQIDKYKAQNLSSASFSKRKGQQLEDAQRKLTDLIKRMKEKQENLLKSQRQAEQVESKLKITQANCDRIKQRSKTLEGEKTADQQKIKALEKEIRLLRNKAERDQESLNKQISKLKQGLQNENSKKKELTNMLSQVENKSKSSQNSKIKQLQKKINKYLQKQNLFKQQLFVLDEQSNKISHILQEKQENQEKFTQSLTMLSQENTILRAKISELENQCQLLNERNQGLEAEIELLNAYQPNQPDNSEIGELNKKLIEKNKELLHQIEEKNLLIAEYEKTEGEMRGKQAQQLLSSSRIQRQRQEYEQKYQEVVDQNERLYKEFEKLNIKYKQQLNEASQASQVKMQVLQSKIEQFFGKLTEKDVKYAGLEMKSKEDLQKLQQNLHEKQYQVQYYSTEMKELTSNIETLNEQVGEKEFQLHLAEQKIKQLFENINNLSLKQPEPAPIVTPQPIIQRNQQHQQEIGHYKSRIQFYESQIERFHEKEFTQEKQLITINEEITKLRQNGEEEVKHISYLQGQLKNCREREGRYIEQIDKLSANENLFKSRYVRLEKDKNQLVSEIDRLTVQIECLKQKLGDKSGQNTPINKFRESPSPLKAPGVDISDIVGQINSILSRRKQEEDLESALRLVIDNNTRQEQQFERWSRQRWLIQQKAKLASKQLQKIKSSIMKNANKSIAQKTQLTNLLKPAQAVVNQLINISENLIELDPYEEQEEQFEGQDTTN